jgi:hypothetical protein
LLFDFFKTYKMLEAGNRTSADETKYVYTFVGAAYGLWLRVLCMPSPLEWTERMDLWHKPVRHINISQIIGDTLLGLFPADLDAAKMAKSGSYPPADLAQFIPLVLKYGKVDPGVAPCFLAWAYACNSGDLIGLITSYMSYDTESYSLLHEQMEKLRVSLGLEHLYQLRDRKPTPPPGTDIPEAKKQASGWDVTATPPPAKRARIESK